MELRPGAEAGIDQPLRLQPIQGGLIERRPLALEIGFVWPRDFRSLVPVQSQPAEIPDHLLRITHGTAGGVQVLDPQDDGSALLPGAEPGQEAAENVPQMNAPAGGGGETANGHIGTFFQTQAGPDPNGPGLLIIP